MNDLISRQEAYDTLTEYYHQRTETQHESLKEALSRVPTIDAVPVVRCKDCKYYKESVALSPQKFCFRMKDRYSEAAIGYNFAEDDFCSYGERSEE